VACRLHCSRRRPVPKGIYQRKVRSPEQRFWQKVEKTAFCWNWTGAKDRKGYGCFYAGSGIGMVLAHRYAFGARPEDMELDHLCRNPSCVNPSHLEFVTPRENMIRGYSIAAMNLRKTHCKRGHPLNGRNLYIPKKGHRRCRICWYRSNKKWQQSQKNALASNG
jgi:hypothetical protein